MNDSEIAKVIGLAHGGGPEVNVFDGLDRKPDTYDKKTGRVVAQGDPKPHLPNIVDVLRHDSRWNGNKAPRVRYNEFSATVEVGGQAITDEGETSVALWMHHVYAMTCKTSMVGEAIRAVAREHSYHPVRGYLQGLKWDQRPRLGRLLTSYLGAADTELNEELSRRWAISAVSRIMAPGSKVDTVLILAGPQGAQKSTAFRELATRPEWFSDTPIDIRNKDAYQAIAGIWLYEMAELASMRPRDAETVKAFISAQVDRYRPPYGRNPVDQPRQCIFVGTTNEAEFLRDSTGARRFWPVKVCEDGATINVPAIQRDRDQLWAEAVRLYLGGERWWLDLNASSALEEQQETWRQVDAWEVRIRDWLAHDHKGHGYDIAKGVTVADVLTSALKVDIDKQHVGLSMRCAGILTGLGFEKRRVQEEGRREIRWYAGDEWERHMNG